MISENGESSSEEVLFTDLCSKSNRKITYLKVREGATPIVIQTSRIIPWSFLQYLKLLVKDIFLPKGYPHSVSSDYMEYQVWDTCQAFCSSISGTLTMRAVMQGIGVGSKAATPVSAAITWIMKDGTGMVGSILFAWLKGSKLDSDCKKWRLFADVLNDIAMFIELYIPFVIHYSTYLLFFSTAFKALVGTAGGSTRAALITHQAINGNVADVSAKDGSQEIFTNLCAFIFGIFLLKNVTETEHIWTVMYTATVLHLLFNYKAVRCLKMNVFNSERFCLSLRSYLPTSNIPTVAQINNRESVFLFRGLSDTEVCGYSISLGVSIKSAIKNQNVNAFFFTTLITLFQEKKYFIIANNDKRKLFIAFRDKFSEIDVLKAYFHAFFLAAALTYIQGKEVLHVMTRSRKNSPTFRLKNILEEFITSSPEFSSDEQQNALTIQAYMACEDVIDKEFAAYCKACEEQGWQLNRHLINVSDWRSEWTYSEEKKEEAIVKKYARPKPKPTPKYRFIDPPFIFY